MLLISIIVPVYNEEKNIPLFFEEFKKINDLLKEKYSFELIFVNDCSSDNSLQELYKIDTSNNTNILIKIIDFARNFGKEIALTAGIENAVGDAILMIDADLQHPIELIPDFIKKWEEGYDVVVGIRKTNKGEGFVKKFGSKMYYSIMNKISYTKIIPRATDFRIIDKSVAESFLKFTEKKRMTRALIDWLGFNRGYIYFNAKERMFGKASYNVFKLFRLAINSFVSHSFFPLKITGYLGIFTTIIFGGFGLFLLIGRYVLKTNFALSFTGSALVAIFNAFLIGIVLSALGLIALYIANIDNEVKNRPLYVIRKKRDNNKY